MIKNRKKINNKTVMTLIVLSLIILFIGYQLREKSWSLKDNERKEEKNIYPCIEENQQNLSGVISDKRYSKVWNGSLLIELSNGQKFSIYDSSTYNYDYDQPYFKGFIQVRDSIYKPENIDSIYVYKNGVKYYFVIGKVINKRS